MKRSERALLGAAVAGILGVASSAGFAAEKKAAEASKNEDVACMGVNACKGKGSCHGEKSGCAGMNACKGQGWVQVSKSVCDQLGGKASKIPSH